MISAGLILHQARVMSLCSVRTSLNHLIKNYKLEVDKRAALVYLLTSVTLGDNIEV